MRPAAGKTPTRTRPTGHARVILPVPSVCGALHTDTPFSTGLLEVTNTRAVPFAWRHVSRTTQVTNTTPPARRSLADRAPQVKVKPLAFYIFLSSLRGGGQPRNIEGVCTKKKPAKANQPTPPTLLIDRGPLVLASCPLPSRRRCSCLLQWPLPLPPPPRRRRTSPRRCGLCSTTPAAGAPLDSR
jgi:hypothetical protein